MKAIITDHAFPSIHLQEAVLVPAGVELQAIQPICKTEADVCDKCKDADVLLVQWAPITRYVLECLPKVKGIVRYGIGVNNVDLDAAKELKIGVANVPTYCLEEVSNHTVSMLIALAKRIPQDHHGIAQGGWGVAHLLPIPSFLDLTLGLVGFGSIARLVAKKAKVFGFRVIVSDPYVKDQVFAENGVEKVDWSTLVESSDLISLHCPLVPETLHLVNRETIARMKPGTIIVNTSRGPVIKEEDLIEALQSDKLSGAGLDVFEVEPLPAHSILRTLPNVILTSHAASVSTRAVDALQTKAAEAALDFLKGRRPEGALVWPF